MSAPLATSFQPADASQPVSSLATRLERVADGIAPAWPLDRFIAVNPLWGRIDLPLPQAAAQVAARCGASLTMDRAWYRSQWEAGRFARRHVERAAAELDVPLDPQRVIDGLDQPAPTLPVREKVTDVLDAARDLRHEMPWAEFVVRQISRHCAAWFDEGQASVRLPRASLYTSWRAQVASDRRPRLLMGLRGVRAAAAALPDDPTVTIARALAALAVPDDQVEPYLDALLLDVHGWASSSAWRRFTARQQDQDDDALFELLAMRIAWEWILLQAAGVHEEWAQARSRWAATDAVVRAGRHVDWALQRAVELAVHEPLVASLSAAPAAEEGPRPDVHAAFCIDVRSEPYRRALEQQSEGIHTLGFAGFFGLPASYQPVGAPEGRPQLPGLLAPSVRVVDTGVDADLAARRQDRVRVRKAAKGFAATSLSGFSYVEALGMLFGPKLVTDALGWTRPVPHPERVGLSPAEHEARRPRLVGATDGSPLTSDAQVALAAGILRGLSLPRGLGRLVALVGHGACMVNNPHAAGYACGACCGQSGEANARAVAGLLNDPAVRERLAGKGLAVPDDTCFVAGLHDTTTDEVVLFDLDLVPTTHSSDVAALQRALAAASEQARRARAPALGLGDVASAQRTAAIRARARDWAQVRPEWGLAGNHSIVIAPGARTRALDLAGRSFLHDYRWQDDDGFGLLELLLTAPMVVSHWINFQYYASTVDNRVFGSGNKVLHNVVGGGIGVYEGNGGDLRIGLPLQSLHDGARWVHEPLRLAVFVQAPREAIDRVIDGNDVVRKLVDGGWVHLHRLEDGPGPVHARIGGTWVQA